MGRIPCCEKDNVKRGQWTPEEDNKLSSYIAQHGTRNWRLIPKNAGLQRCGKSCRLRWTNYLRPDLKHGQFSEAEEQTIVKLHSVVGNRWSLIAAQLPGRTDNDVKNHWNTKLKKKLSGMGIDPVTHKPFSHLMAEIATTLAPPQVAHLAEAALGCFKDEMLHLLTKKRVDFQLQQSGGGPLPAATAYGGPTATDHHQDDDTIEQIKMGLSRAMMHEPNNMVISNKSSWDSIGETSNGGYVGGGGGFHGASVSGFQYGFGNEGDHGSPSPWNQSVCTGSTGGGGGGEHHQQGRFSERIVDHHQDEINGDDDESDHQGGKGTKSGASLFNSECVLWDIPSDDLMMNPLI